MTWQVRTEVFEGPLDLLLYLVTKDKLDITEVSLAKVADDYFAYLKMLEQLDLDVESSYLVVFACLLELKSRLLLPPEPEEAAPDVEDLDLGDTAEVDLVDRLKEYKRFKEAGQALSEREREAMLVFPRPVALTEMDGFSPEPAFDVSLPDLLEALRGLLETHQKQAKSRTRLRVERVSMSVPQRMADIVAQLEMGRQTEFFALFAGEITRSSIIITFLAILELARQRRIRLFQESKRAPIVVELVSTEPIDAAAVEQASEPGGRRGRKKSVSRSRSAERGMSGFEIAEETEDS